MYLGHSGKCDKSGLLRGKKEQVISHNTTVQDE